MTCDHAVLKRPETWPTLPLLVTMDDGEGGTLELRNCPACDSTLAVHVEEERAAA